MFLFYDSEDDMFHSRYTAFISVFWYQQKNILGYSVTVKYLMLWGSFLTVVCKDEGIFFSLFQLLGNKFWNEIYYKTVNFLIYWTIWIHVALFNQNKRINNIFFPETFRMVIQAPDVTFAIFFHRRLDYYLFTLLQ